MSSIGTFLGRDHQQCDDQYALAEARVVGKQWELAAGDFATFRGMLEHHLGMEEQLMFPALEQAMGHSGGPTAVMRGEHAHMRDLVQGMADAIVAQDGEEFFNHADTLRMLMRQHNLKEEGILYPMADRFLDGQLPQLLEQMRAFEAAAEQGALP
ncbi:hemerythrin domain-containing protein [Duganella sp. LX20W]|uniref:Hemerythrin domain-containing protein n=1 Tax=Rugamonas brunnea TaxID=2758569 RepID=A0A7W2ETN9_9BURK|nr:hemerythrin domain-containing protein [Rugamonas brunnea]MBA5638433.1 hemerythrin domain-containing protein [Rugamonas brunnea]